MSSMFDTNVYNRRQHTPWAAVNFMAFAKEMTENGAAADAKLAEQEGISLRNYHSAKNDFVLIVQPRPDVSSRFWFIAKWTGEDGRRHQVEAQYFDLCMWRAAQVELDIQKRLEAESEA